MTLEEGKWYVCTQTYTLRGKIVVIKGQTYKSNQDGAIEGEDGHLFIDKIDGKALNYFKPWTIKDAKDGDVLADRGRAILLFRDVGNKEWSDAIDYYALLETNMDNRFSLQEGGAYWGKVDNCTLCPATKEQRDLLFQKMKEAGYEWNSKKKELKKIELKPLMEGVFVNVDEVREDFIQEVYRVLNADPTNDRANQIIYAFDHLPTITIQKPAGVRTTGYWHVEDVKQKPAKWHREDEQNLNACIGYIPDEFLRRWLTDIIHVKYDKSVELPKGEDYGIDGLYAAVDILKKTLGKVDGYQSDDGILEHKCAISAVKKLYEQNPWSEEDEKLLALSLSNLTEIKDRYGEGYGNVGKCIDWLKSLIPLPKQEWSEEDKEFINDLIGIFDGQQYQAHSDEEIVKWLKSIRLPYNKEWDENDEEMLKSIIATCELACEDRDSSPARHLLQMQTDWLKSLKDRYTWKPSDEQMDALYDAAVYVDKSMFPYPKGILMKLYKQLKKLREE